MPIGLSLSSKTGIFCDNICTLLQDGTNVPLFLMCLYYTAQQPLRFRMIKTKQIVPCVL